MRSERIGEPQDHPIPTETSKGDWAENDREKRICLFSPEKGEKLGGHPTDPPEQEGGTERRKGGESTLDSNQGDSQATKQFLKGNSAIGVERCFFVRCVWLPGGVYRLRGIIAKNGRHWPVFLTP